MFRFQYFQILFFILRNQLFITVSTNKSQSMMIVDKRTFSNNFKIHLIKEVGGIVYLYYYTLSKHFGKFSFLLYNLTYTVSIVFTPCRVSFVSRVIFCKKYNPNVSIYRTLSRIYFIYSFHYLTFQFVFLAKLKYPHHTIINY